MVQGGALPERQWAALKLLGHSKVMLTLREDICRYASMSAPILILGETGTGKENVAKACHALSQRAAQPFVIAQCSAFTETLLESELFGHVEGAFTGANKKRVGRFQEANAGTIFLDEVGTIATSTQVKLLRVLQEKRIEPVGSNKAAEADVRVIAATNEDLDQALQSGRLRRDFYARLAYFEIRVPPLRDRQDDVILLAENFLGQVCAENGRATASLSSGAKARLCRHSWPGNVRELQSVVHRAVAKMNATSGVLDEDLIAFDGRLGVGHATHAAEEDGQGHGASVHELVAQKTLDLMLNGKKPLEGILKGSEAVSELLDDVIGGVIEGVARYLETDAGTRLRRNGGVGVILERLGMSSRSGGKSVLARQVQRAIQERLNKDRSRTAPT